MVRPLVALLAVVSPINRVFVAISDLVIGYLQFHFTDHAQFFHLAQIR